MLASSHVITLEVVCIPSQKLRQFTAGPLALAATAVFVSYARGINTRARAVRTSRRKQSLLVFPRQCARAPFLRIFSPTAY